MYSGQLYRSSATGDWPHSHRSNSSRSRCTPMPSAARNAARPRVRAPTSPYVRRMSFHTSTSRSGTAAAIDVVHGGKRPLRRRVDATDRRSPRSSTLARARELMRLSYAKPAGTRPMLVQQLAHAQHDHREPQRREQHVVVERVGGASGRRAPSPRGLGRRREAGQAREAGALGERVVGEEPPTQVEQGIADRAHLPVEDRDHVEVAVDRGCSSARRPTRAPGPRRAARAGRRAGAPALRARVDAACRPPPR